MTNTTKDTLVFKSYLGPHAWLTEFTWFLKDPANVDTRNNRENRVLPQYSEDLKYQHIRITPSTDYPPVHFQVILVYTNQIAAPVAE